MANAIKALTNRLQGMNDEGEKDLEIKAKQEELFNKLNLSLYKQDGSLRDIYSILNELAPVYQQLDNATKGYVTQTLAGVHQSGRMAAILNNWTVAQEALTTAQNSSGSAMKENEKVLESIQGRIQMFKSAFEELSTSVIGSGLVKGVVDLGTALLKIANSDGVKFIATVTLITTGLNLANKGVKLLSISYKSIQKDIARLIAIQQAQAAGLTLTDMSTKRQIVANSQLIASNLTLGASFKALTVAMMTNPLFGVAGVVAAVMGFINVVDWLTISYKEQKEKLNNLKQEYEDTKNKISETESELESTQKRIEELQTKGPLSIIEQDELDKLKINNSLLDKQIQLLEKQAELKREEARQTAIDTMNTFDYTPKDTREARRDARNIGKNALTKSYSSIGESNSQVGRYEENTEAIKKLNDEIDRLKQKQDELNTETKKGEKEFKKIAETVENYEQHIEKLKDENTELAVAFSEYIDILEGGDDKTEEIRQKLIGFVEAQTEAINNTEESTEVTEKKAKSLKELNEEIDKVQSAYKTLEDAVKEYNENGYITLDTLQALLDLDAEYLLNLDLKNAKIGESTDLLYEQANALIEARLATLQDAYAKDVNALAAGNMGEMSGFAQKAVGILGTETENAGLKASASAGNFVEAAKGIGTLKATIDDNFNVDGFISNLEKIDAAYNKVAANISNLKVGGGTTGSGAKSGKSSSAKKEKEWWETELQKLQDQFKYSETTIDEYIGGLESILGRLQAGSDEWKKINEELQKQRLQKIKDDYSDGRISLEQYIEKLKELQRQYRENTTAWLELARALKSALIEQQSNLKLEYDQAYKSVEKIINDQIKAIQDLRNAEQKRYNDLIDAKKKANQETKDEITLAELQERLEYAKNDRNKRVWNEALGTWEWIADEKAIKDRQQELDDFLFDKEIKALEEERDAALASFDEQIKGWEEYKDQWSSILSEYEDAQNYKMMIDKLGADAEAQILAQRLDVLQKFKEEYINIQEEIARLNAMSVNEISGSSSNGTGRYQAGMNVTTPNGKGVIAYAEGTRYIVEVGNKQDWYDEKDIQSYSSGGIVDYTGLAMVHGTKSNPEMVLNNDQIGKLFNFLNQMPKTVQNESRATNSHQKNYYFDKLVLPNVKDEKDFMRELDVIANLNK